MRALNKRTGQLEKVYVKALDSMPVGTVVEFNGQASDIPSGWEEVSGENKIRKVSLKTPTGAHIVDGYSTSTTDGYSCNYVNNAIETAVQDVYSTDEVKTNKIRLGKPVYRKTLSGTLPTGVGNNTFSFANNEKITKVEGMVKSIYNNWWNISTYYAETAYNISYYLNNDRNALNIVCGSNYNTNSNYEITIEYTKTTD